MPSSRLCQTGRKRLGGVGTTYSQRQRTVWTDCYCRGHEFLRDNHRNANHLLSATSFWSIKIRSPHNQRLFFSRDGR
ncbi:MAG: hypothetical protein Ct9H300mP25_17170 [Acidobacteriota bacterium]|nr:MAG: hypothetical protein Ct9H300mP25_17170 [Acidobacteriota bacterium]